MKLKMELEKKQNLKSSGRKVEVINMICSKMFIASIMGNSG